MANESQVLKVVTHTSGKLPTATVSLVDESGEPIDLGGGGAVSWDDLTDKPAFIASGADAAAARTSLGLGSLATASTITSAQITDGTITNADISASAAIALSKLANVAAGDDGLAAGTLQETLQALATRIQALEGAG